MGRKAGPGKHRASLHFVEVYCPAPLGQTGLTFSFIGFPLRAPILLPFKSSFLWGHSLAEISTYTLISNVRTEFLLCQVHQELCLDTAVSDSKERSQCSMTVERQVYLGHCN